MGFRTNTTERVASRVGFDKFEIFAETDYPNQPVAGVITLDSGLYVIKASYTTANRFLVAPGATVQITFDSVFNTIINYTGSDTLFSTTGANFFELARAIIVLTGANSTVFSLTGVTSRVVLNSVGLSFFNTGQTVGNFTSCNILQLNEMIIDGHLFGATFTDCVGILFDELSWQPVGSGTTANINILGKLFFGFACRSNQFLNGPGESAFFIDPDIGNPESIIIRDTFALGFGTFFKAGATGAITNIVDASTPSLSVIAVNNFSGQAEYQTSVAHNYSVGDLVFHTNFGTASHLGSKTITQVNGPTAYLTGDTDTTDETGNSIAPRATITSTAHGQTLDTPILLIDTINFNGGFLVKNPLTNTFVIWLTFLFPGAETTGNWDAGSLTERDKRLKVSDNGKQKNSLTTGGWTVAGNTSDTSILDGTYGDIDFTGATPLSFNEGLTLFDAASGAMRKDRVDPEVLTVPIEFLLSPNGGGLRTYQFKLVISTDGGASFVDLPDVIETQEEFSGSGVERLFQTTRTVAMNEGDIIKYQVEGVGTTNSFLAKQGCTSI